MFTAEQLNKMSKTISERLGRPIGVSIDHEDNRLCFEDIDGFKHCLALPSNEAFPAVMLEWAMRIFTGMDHERLMTIRQSRHDLKLADLYTALRRHHDLSRSDVDNMTYDEAIALLPEK